MGLQKSCKVCLGIQFLQGSWDAGSQRGGGGSLTRGRCWDACERERGYSAVSGLPSQGRAASPAAGPGPPPVLAVSHQAASFHRWGGVASAHLHSSTCHTWRSANLAGGVPWWKVSHSASKSNNRPFWWKQWVLLGLHSRPGPTAAGQDPHGWVPGKGRSCRAQSLAGLLLTSRGRRLPQGHVGIRHGC